MGLEYRVLEGVPTKGCWRGGRGPSLYTPQGLMGDGKLSKWVGSVREWNHGDQGGAVLLI